MLWSLIALGTTRVEKKQSVKKGEYLWQRLELCVFGSRSPSITSKRLKEGFLGLN